MEEENNYYTESFVAKKQKVNEIESIKNKKWRDKIEKERINSVDIEVHHSPPVEVPKYSWLTSYRYEADLRNKIRKLNIKQMKYDNNIHILQSNKDLGEWRGYPKEGYFPVGLEL